MEIKTILIDHLCHLIVNYISTGDYITKHTMVTFIPPILHYVNERFRFNPKTNYLLNILLETFVGTVKKLDDGYRIEQSAKRLVNGEEFKNILEQIIKDCIIEKNVTFVGYYNLKFEKNTKSVDQITKEIEKINQWVTEKKDEFREKIKKLYYTTKSPVNFYKIND